MAEEDKTAAPKTRKLPGKRKTATLDLAVPEGFDVDRFWQVRDASKLRGNLDVEIEKGNEVFVITVRGPKKTSD